MSAVFWGTFFKTFFILNFLLYSYYLPWIKIKHACVSVCLHCFLFTVFLCLCLQEPVLSKEQPAFQYSSHVSLQAPSGHMWWERCSTRCICSPSIHIHIHCPVCFQDSTIRPKQSDERKWSLALGLVLKAEPMPHKTSYLDDLYWFWWVDWSYVQPEWCQQIFYDRLSCILLKDIYPNIRRDVYVFEQFVLFLCFVGWKK